jgi:hypothetical protein
VLQQVIGLIDQTIGIPGLDSGAIFDVSIRSDQAYHPCCPGGDNVTLVITDINTVTAIDLQAFGCNLKWQRVGFTMFERITADHDAGTLRETQLFEQGVG